MRNENLYTLLPLEDFKAIQGIDDREDKLATFCLVTATLTIEHYCQRKFLRKKYFEQIEYLGDLLLPLREYPVSDVLAVFTMTNGNSNGEILEPDFYNIIPECGSDYDLPFSIILSRALLRYQGLYAIKAVYWAGYITNEQLAMSNEQCKRGISVPADLSAACLELASWNFNRYRGRRIGLTGNIKGSGKEGEHFEMSMPENVKALLEPYRRKLI